MISRPTVLILGAGASFYYGYPVGAGLLFRLCDQRTKMSDDSFPNGWTADEADELLLRLSRSAYYSVDAFLEDCPDHIPLGKYLIAQELKQHEDVGGLFRSSSSGWYQHLFNQLLVDKRPDFEKNEIGIITFNYDRSLEAYLHTVLQNRFAFTVDEATDHLDRIPIVHVHGILGSFPETPYTAEADPAEIARISEQIEIIHEIEDNERDFCNDAFRDSHEMLQKAERIFFLGFGFHPDNLRRFQFFNPENVQGKELRSTTYRMQTLDYERLSRALAAYGITSEIFREMFPRNDADCEKFFSRTALLE